MGMLPASGWCNPMSSFSSTLFPRPLPPTPATVSPCATVKSIPSRTRWLPNVLVRPWTATGGWLLDFFISTSLEKHHDHPDQHDIRHDDEQRREHHGAGRGSSHACRASLRAHSLEGGYKADNEPEHGGLEGGRKEVAEANTLESGFDEQAQRNGIGERGG